MSQLIYVLAIMSTVYDQHWRTADFHLHREWNSVFALAPCKHRGDNEQAAEVPGSGLMTNRHAVIPQPFRRVLAMTGSHKAWLPWPATVISCRKKRKKGWKEWCSGCVKVSNTHGHTCIPHIHSFFVFVRTFTNTIMSPGPILNPTITAKCLTLTSTQFYPEPQNRPL